MHGRDGLLEALDGDVLHEAGVDAAVDDAEAPSPTTSSEPLKLVGTLHRPVSSAALYHVSRATREPLASGDTAWAHLRWTLPAPARTLR
jgi:hypothetical protein